ncbi:MAG TPA: hypothetical protein PK718_04130 [Candidatus Methanofastidiosa archaeon]|nr:hypothetical protein [Candidatus Methanofastidiosa archaeon]
MENNDTSMKDMSIRAYDHAVNNGIYNKIVEGEVDVSQTLEYFNVKSYATPCEAVKRRYEMIVNNTNCNKNIMEFIHQFAIYYAFLDLFKGILDLACIRYDPEKEKAIFHILAIPLREMECQC